MLLAILVAMAVAQSDVVSAEGPVDGTYTMTLTANKCDLSDNTGTGVLHLEQGA